MTMPGYQDDAVRLDAYDFPLKGSRLIEASAGTGKTFTIAALYLRLVLGHGSESAFRRALAPSEILVMTFTRAATRELSDRIRARLLEAVRCFRGESEPPPDDQFLARLLADYPAGPARAEAAWRLATAAEGMDDAAVFTIDAWCQRMLRENAFDSGSLFDEELVADEDAMLLEASQDYWRQQCYPLDEAHLRRLLDVWSSVDALHADMRALITRDIGDASAHDSLAQVLDRAREKQLTEINQVKAGWAQRASEMKIWILGQLDADSRNWNTRSLTKRNLENWTGRLAAWAGDSSALEMPNLGKGWEHLTPDGLLNLRTPDSAPIEIPAVFGEFASLQDALKNLPQVEEPVRRHAAVWVDARLAQLKRQAGAFGFADMLRRLEHALHGPAGARLRERIVRQYPVAMIDEFQDTSPVQYRIFDCIYRTATNDPATALLLIGDPKQSIYGFRGADIYSYLAARQATQGRHYALETNFRSTQALVDAVNALFERAERESQQGAFGFRRGDANPLPFRAVAARGQKDRLVAGHAELPALEIVTSQYLESATKIYRRFGELCAQRIAEMLADSAVGFSKMDEPLRRIRPADIAVLVRTGKEARAVRRALRRRGVASVYLSDKDSVFASDEARDLLHWLRAVAAPADLRLARAGLATAMIGFDLETLARFAADDEAFDRQAEQLRLLLGIWRTQGVLAMLRKTMHLFALPARWIEEADGERRLTNLLHLAELLQGAAVTLEGEHALIRWLVTQIQDSDGAGEEQIVRLESDSDLVKVVTIHKSKGLQYPYVFLPYATCFREFTRKGAPYLELADDNGQRILHLSITDSLVAQGDAERLREDLRLFYVALTRAQYGVWMGFSALKVGNRNSCSAAGSAAGYLTAMGKDPGAQGWHDVLATFGARVSGVSVTPAPDDVPLTRLPRETRTDTLRGVVDYAARFDQTWSISSFTGLVRDLHTAPLMSPLSLLHAPRPADDETPVAAMQDEAAVQDAQSSQSAQTDAPQRIPVAAPGGTRHAFARGPVAGNFLHDQLEWLAAERFALAGDDRLQSRLAQRCERAGYGRFGGDLVTWISDIVTTPLPGPGVPLCEIDRLIPEMEFWLPAHGISASVLDQLCAAHLLDGIQRPRLPDRTVHGMLKGFADLVFEHGGRYWVLDYKSNYLGATDADYDKSRLAASMAEHRYDMQAAIYMAALHRLLRSRLGAAYDPDSHLGGAVYVYLRGIAGPERGVCLLRPSRALLDGIDAMLGTGEVVQ